MYSRIIRFANFDVQYQIVLLSSIPNIYSCTRMLSRLSFIAVLFLVTVFLTPYGLFQKQPAFVTSFADLSGQAIVTSNDECEPGSLVHCIGGELQKQQKGLVNGGGNAARTTITTSSERSDSMVGQTQYRDELSTPKGFLYVGNAKSNSVAVIDLATNAIVKNITVGKSPHDIKIFDDQQTVYTTDIDSV